jgi:hypothetical protein
VEVWAHCAKAVAQIFNLVYRRFSIGRGWEVSWPSGFTKASRLQIRDTAVCNSALRGCGSAVLNVPRFKKLEAILETIEEGQGKQIRIPN